MAEGCEFRRNCVEAGGLILPVRGVAMRWIENMGVGSLV